MAASAGARAPVAAPLADKVADRLEPKPKRRKRMLLLLLGLVGVAAVVFKKIRSATTGGAPSYAPPPPRPRPVPDPAAATTPPPPPAQHFEPDPDAPADPAADAVSDAGPGAETTDKGGSFFDEMVADADEHPHQVTTPDQPAETEEAHGPKRVKK